MSDRLPTSSCSSCSQDCASDADAGFEITARHERFNQKDDIFCRSFWDAQVHSEKTDSFYESYRRPLED